MPDMQHEIVLDPLFVGAARPPMKWGVTYAALVMNMVVTMEIFLVSKVLLTLLLALPIHGLCALLCARDPRFFELGAAWCRTRLPAYACTYRFWRASSYSPLAIDPPNPAGRRRAVPFARV
jgi:type IV secretion system protein VirB3